MGTRVPNTVITVRSAEQPAPAQLEARGSSKGPDRSNDAEAVRRRRATANRVLTYLKAALNHAWRSGTVPNDDSWRRVKPFRSVNAPVVRYLSENEITRLLNACAGGFRDLVHVALLTGRRYGELCRLKVADYNADVSTVTIRLGKGGKARHVTPTDEASELFDRIVAGRPCTDAILRHDDDRSWKRSEQIRPMLEACEQAGIVPAVGFTCCDIPTPRSWKCARCRWR